MFSIRYISITMRIFYIDWQQHWECDWTTNIGANAHGKRTVSAKQHNCQTWQLGFQWHQRGIELVFRSLDCHNATVSQWDHFFAATFVFVVWNFTKLIWEGGGALSSSVFIFWCLVLRYLDRRGYFDVSNVALVFVYMKGTIVLCPWVPWKADLYI